MPNLACFARQVLHGVSRPSGAPQSCLPVRNTQKGARSLAGQADCKAVTIEGGIPPSNKPRHFGISKEFRNVKVMVVAGEASGDLHAANLIHQLKGLVPSSSFFGMGGPKMKDEGVELSYHVRDLSLIGFSEALRRLPFFRRVMREMVNLLEKEGPDLVILVDYPGFNLRFAHQVKRRGIPLVYYICPQVWAWGGWRIKKMARLVDRAIVVFPFEADLYRKVEIKADFVGHPLLEVMKEEPDREAFRQSVGVKNEEKILGLFPGSREGEVKRILPLMLETCRLLSKRIWVRPFLALSPNISPSLVRSLSQGYELEILKGRNYELMASSSLVLVASGTATLEATILGTPMVIVYRLSSSSWFLGRLLVRLPHIGMVNILAGKRLVPELIQKSADPERIAFEAWRLLKDERRRKEMSQGLLEVKEGLGKPGAYLRAARIVAKVLEDG